MKRKMMMAAVLLLAFGTAALAQNLRGKPYTPGEDPDIDQYLGSWWESTPRHTHGTLILRDILTKGSSMSPPRKGAVLEYVNGFSFATLAARATTANQALSGNQWIIFIRSGEGVLEAGGKSHALYEGIAALIPAGLAFRMRNTGTHDMTMYLIDEPIPAGFLPNPDVLVRDENTIPISGTTGHWVHIVKPLFNTADGLGTLEAVLTVGFDPMTIGHPHSHGPGVEEVWTQMYGSSIMFMGTQIRRQEPGMGYMIPPDGQTPHSNINISETEPTKMLYFARYGDHAVRP